MKKKCAFLIHPRDIEDLFQRLADMLHISKGLCKKIIPAGIANILPKLKGRMGFTVCSKFDIYGIAEGYLIAVLLTPEQMKNSYKLAQQRILETAVFARKKLRVDVVGLGAYTAPLTNNGIAVADRLDCIVTHGDSLSSASIIPALEQCAIMKNLIIKDSTLAIVGGGGVVGRSASILVSRLNPRRLILTGRKSKTKLAKVAKEIGDGGYQGQIEIYVNDNSRIINADAIILTTTSPGSIISSEMLKRNAIVIDVAQPPNMSQEVCDQRSDILRVSGGIMSIPGINLGFDMRLSRGTAFACLTETILTALMLADGREMISRVGRVDVDFATAILGEAHKRGFVIAPLSSFSKPIDTNQRMIVGERQRQEIGQIKTAGGGYL